MFSLSKCKDELAVYEMGKAEGGAGPGKVISRHMKAELPIGHPVEKPVGLRHVGPRVGSCRLELHMGDVRGQVAFRKDQESIYFVWLLWGLNE